MCCCRNLLQKLQKETIVKVNKKIVIVGLAVTLLVGFSFQSKFFEVAKQIEIYNTLFKELNMYYVDEINPGELTTKAINNTLKDLDPYTNYYNEQDVEDAKIRRAGEYGGIGVGVYYTKEGILLKEIYKDYPADKAELKAGDLIISVDGQSIKNMERDQLSMFLKGIPNSTFEVEVNRQGEVFKSQLTREKVIVNPVPFFDMIDAETGYIPLTTFNSKASSEIKKAFRELKKKGMTKLVLDLRYNLGGSLLEAINISNFFLPKGKTIVSTKAKIKKWSNTYRGTRDPLDLDIPIVVLVNDRSASASEIVSGALQDYDRAIILGDRTFGKGLVQRYRDLTYGTQLKLTISKYYTPSGRCIQELDYANRDDKTGVVPKFSDGGVNEFKTENGRKVYDGGGVMPDVKLELSEKNETTKSLIGSRSIFNFTNKYVNENSSKPALDDIKVNDAVFKDFVEFIVTDTTFVTKEENLFKEAFKASKLSSVEKEYRQIQKKISDIKVDEVTRNKDRLIPIIQDEIIKRYYYKEGVYQYNLKYNAAILKAKELLNNPLKYKQILSVN